MTARSIIIKGKVQGVNFRYYTMLEARRLGLAGTVENLDNGSVLVKAEGEISAIETLIKWCRKGPLLASVERVEVDEIAVAGHKSFVIVQ